MWKVRYPAVVTKGRNIKSLRSFVNATIVPHAAQFKIKKSLRRIMMIYKLKEVMSKGKL
jgi:hypothetical protein